MEFDEPVAVVVLGEHFVGPLLDAGIVLFQPGFVILAARHNSRPQSEARDTCPATARDNWYSAHVVGIVGHAVGFAAGQNSVEGLAKRSKASGASVWLSANGGVFRAISEYS